MSGVRVSSEMIQIPLKFGFKFSVNDDTIMGYINSPSVFLAMVQGYSDIRGATFESEEMEEILPLKERLFQ